MRFNSTLDDGYEVEVEVSGGDVEVVSKKTGCEVHITEAEHRRLKQEVFLNCQIERLQAENARLQAACTGLGNRNSELMRLIAKCYLTVNREQWEPGLTDQELSGLLHGELWDSYGLEWRTVLLQESGAGDE